MSEDKDMKSVTTTVSYMFKQLKEWRGMVKEKKIQVNFLETETTMTKMKNKMDGINSRFENGRKKYFQEFEDINNGNNPKWNIWRKKWQKYEQSTSELWNTFEWPNVCVIEVLKREERQQRRQKKYLKQ